MSGRRRFGAIRKLGSGRWQVRYRDPTPTEGASVYPACQNLLLAARALGYGGVLTVWHGLVETELRALLGVPDTVFMAATITLGLSEERTAVDVTIQMVPTATVSGTIRAVSGVLPQALRVTLVPAVRNIKSTASAANSVACCSSSLSWSSNGMPAVTSWRAKSMYSRPIRSTVASATATRAQA